MSTSLRRVIAGAFGLFFFPLLSSCTAATTDDEIVEVEEQAQTSAYVPDAWLDKPIKVRGSCNVHHSWFDTSGLSGYWHPASEDLRRDMILAVTFRKTSTGYEIAIDRTGGPLNVPDQSLRLAPRPQGVRAERHYVTTRGVPNVDQYDLTYDGTTLGGSFAITSNYGRRGWSSGPGDDASFSTCTASFTWANAEAMTPPVNVRMSFDTDDVVHALCNNGKSVQTLDLSAACVGQGGALTWPPSSTRPPGHQRYRIVATQCTGFYTCTKPGCGWDAFMTPRNYEGGVSPIAAFSNGVPYEFRVARSTSIYGPTPRFTTSVTNGEWSWEGGDRKASGIILPPNGRELWMTYSYPQTDDRSKRTTCTSTWRLQE